MSEETRKDVEQVVTAFNLLPDEKRSFLIGYAEGVIAASERRKENEKAPA